MFQKIPASLKTIFDILFSFIPWIAFSLLIRTNSVTSEIIAAQAAIFLTLVINFNKLRKGFILDWGTLLFFCGLTIELSLNPNMPYLQDSNIISNLAITLIVFISWAIGKPFTLQYAKQTTPSFIWQTPAFLQVNNTITLAWGMVFLIITLLQLATKQALINNTLSIIIEIALYIFVIKFTQYYPQFYSAKRYWAYRKQLQPLDTKFLKNNFTPIKNEIFEKNLVMTGSLPADFSGIYMRNGPNPQFEPFAYQFPLDGDAMLHALYFEQGNVSYRNRFVLTPELIAERKYNGAIYGSVTFPIKPDFRLLNKDCDPQVKIGAFIHIIKIGDEILAMHEASPAYQMSDQLQTIAKWHPKNRDTIIPINAHTRTDPITKTLYAITYNIEKAPYLTLYHFNEIGNLLAEVAIEKEYPTLIHDFVITENFIVIIDSPAIFDLAAIVDKKNILQWQPQRGTAIALIPRDDLQQKPQWLKTKAFFAYHYSNAYENDGKIEMLCAYYAGLETSKTDDFKSQLMKISINLSNQKIDFQNLDVPNCEFLRVNDQYQAKQNRYSYMLVMKDEHFSQLVKYDSQTQQASYRDFTGYDLSEAIFVPASNATAEDDGYILFFAYHIASDRSYFYLIKAQDLLGEPQAIIHLPQRVPNGLHGNFFATLQ